MQIIVLNLILILAMSACAALALSSEDYGLALCCACIAVVYTWCTDRDIALWRIERRLLAKLEELERAYGIDR